MTTVQAERPAVRALTPAASRSSSSTVMRSLTSGLVLTVLATIATVNIVLYLIQTQQLENALRVRATSSVSELAGILELPMWNFDNQAIERAVRIYGELEDVVLVRVVDNAGRVVAVQERNDDEVAAISANAPILFEDRLIGSVEFGLSMQILERERQTALLSTTTSALFLIAAIVVTNQILLRRFLRRPLNQLTEGLNTIATGSYDYRLASSGKADLDVIVETVNNMAQQISERDLQLRDLIQTLEDRVSERTHDLEIAAEVSRQITTVLDTDALLAQVVEATLTSFRLYYVAVFLYDNTSQKLKIQKGTGDAGEQMKAEALQFHLTDLGLIPKAAHLRQTVRVDDILLSPDYAAVPYLPQTRSELVMPMLIGDHLIGVLDLQAAEVGRFSAEVIRVMSSLAGQIAIAVRNAELYAESRQSREAAEESNRVKSQFLASMSHELRTPMNAILNFSQFIASGMFGPVNDEQVDVLSKVVSSGEHLLSLINDVLDISKIESGALKLFVEPNIYLVNELEVAISTTKVLLNDKPVEVITQIHGEIPAMIGDKRRLRQIMLNLFSNACKFTDEGHITLELSANEQEIILAVHDTGPGIDAKDYEIIFETFRQSQSGLRQGDGTGLGLPISRHLAEAHGGRLWLTSVIGEGTSFYVALPIESDILKPLLKVKKVHDD